MAKETHADPSGIAPWVAANAMLGLCRPLVTHVRQQVLAGEHDRARLARELCPGQTGGRAARAGLGQLGS